MGLLLQKRRIKIASSGRNHLVAYLSSGSVHGEVTCVNGGNFGLASQHDFHLTSQLLRIPFVIVVQKSDVVTLGVANPRVSCRGSSPTAVMSDPADSFVFERIDDFIDGVIGSVVHNNKLKIAEGLVQHAANSYGQQLWSIAGRNNNTDLHSYPSIQTDSNLLNCSDYALGLFPAWSFNNRRTTQYRPRKKQSSQSPNTGNLKQSFDGKNVIKPFRANRVGEFLNRVTSHTDSRIGVEVMRRGAEQKGEAGRINALRDTDRILIKRSAWVGNYRVVRGTIVTQQKITLLQFVNLLVIAQT